MYVLYTALDGRDAVVVPAFQYISLPENLRYTTAVTRASRHPNLFAVRNLDDRTVARVDFDVLPDPVKALIVLYEM